MRSGWWGRWVAPAAGGKAGEAAIALQVRPLTAEEEAELARRVASRTVAARLGVGADVVRTWITRFNGAGLAGLEDRPRSGRPPTYTAEQVGQAVATALTNPEALG